MTKQTLLAGSYNLRPFGEGRGITVLEYEPESGGMRVADVCEDTVNPSYLIQVGQLVLAAQETLETGGIAAYRFEGGRLARLGTTHFPGGLLCHLALWPGGRYLSAANYWTGRLTVCPVTGQGAGEPTAALQYEGAGADPKRQEGPHTHSSCVDPSGSWLVVAELGLDRLMSYRLDPAAGTLTPGSPAFLQTPAGAGPRHMAFHPNGRTLYVSAELSSSVFVCGFDPATGAITLRQVLPALPEGFSGDNLTADIHCTADGRLVYASNRGHDSIASFGVQEDGSLRALGHFSCFGSGPRSIRLMNHAVMLIANQNSGTLVSCRLDGAGGCSGKLAELPLPSVVCTLPLNSTTQEERE